MLMDGRKYRVLDDCARLREVLVQLQTVSALRYTPALVVLTWADVDGPDAAQEFGDMVRRTFFVESSSLRLPHSRLELCLTRAFLEACRTSSSPPKSRIGIPVSTRVCHTRSSISKTSR